MPDGSHVGHGMSASLVTLPNIITFGRLCIVPLAFWAVLERRLDYAFMLFVLAGMSDAVDGWLARRQGGGNIVGAVLDPAADKALLVTMFVTLAAVNVLPDWIAILVVFRDVVIIGGILVLRVLGHAVAIRPLRISKVNTALQIILVGLALGMHGFGLQAPLVLTAAVWLVAASTLGSGAAYVWVTARNA
jgi:cardiolipin synthase